MSSSKGHKAVPNRLFQLLNINIYDGEQLQADAVIEEARQSPESAAMEYKFTLYEPWSAAVKDYIERHGTRKKITCYPLHRAIKLGAGIDVVQAIYNSYPSAIEATYKNRTAPYIACSKNIPAEVTCFLFNKFPAAAKEKDHRDFLPLHHACICGASFEVVSLLLEIYPDALQVRNCRGGTAFHYATGSKEVMSLMMDYCPQVVKDKDKNGKTPLHYACSRNAPLEAILLLLERWPEAIKERDGYKKTPIDCYERSSIWTRNIGRGFDQRKAEGIRKLLLCVDRIFGNSMDADVSREMMDFFIRIQWWSGVLMILDQYPPLKKQMNIDTHVFPTFLSVVGWRCTLKTMWHIIGNELDIIEGI